MQKGINLKQVENVFNWCRDEGVITIADFMFGNLDEKKEDIHKSLNLVKQIKPDFVQYSICSPYPGTPLYEIGLEKGVIKKDVWLDFAKDPLSEFNSPLWTQHFTEEELVKITASAYRAFYLRPSFIIKQLGRINSFAQIKNMLLSVVGMLKTYLHRSV